MILNPKPKLLVGEPWLGLITCLPSPAEAWGDARHDGWPSAKVGTSAFESTLAGLTQHPHHTVEARKLEHSCPHTLKVKYKGS